MSDDSNTVDLNAARAALEGAKRMTADEPPVADFSREDAGPDPADMVPPEQALRPDGLPDDCPIRALGRGPDGKTFYYMSDLNQLTVLRANDHTHQYFAAMCGKDIGYLTRRWPQKKLVKTKGINGETVEDWIVTGFHSGQIRDALMQAASFRGLWSPADKLRGPGAWADDDGRLILHLGDKIARASAEGISWHVPGELDGYVYSASAPLPKPSEKPVGTVDHSAQISELVSVLRTWNWKRPGIDDALTFGWLCAAILGGALDIRPILWITGDAATGKTTLHQLLKLLLGEMLLKTGDTSAAGLYQRVGQGSIPIAVDELEPSEEGGEKQAALIRLARNAFSGDVFLRGGADHNGVQFQARSAFLFSSILIPPLGTQDRTRMAILELQRLGPGTKPVSLDAAHWRAVGRALLRRLLDQWPRFAQTLARYEQALGGVGHSLRGARQLGTLLAAREIVLFDGEVDSDTLDEWASALPATATSDHESDAEQCLNHLCQAVPDHWRGGSRSSVAQLVDKFMNAEVRSQEAQDASAALATGGCRVLMDRSTGQHFLAVANNHEGTRMLFRGSRWEGKAGLDGVWRQALLRVDGASASNQRIAKRMTRCTLVPVAAILTGENDEGGTPSAASTYSTELTE